MNDLVFVYGSLKRGYHGHGQMEGAAFAGAALTRDPAYRMVAFPWPGTPHEAYPGLLPEAKGGFVSGEVYEVSPALLTRLDAFEVVGRDYNRERIALADGRSAWTYLSLNAEGQGVLYEHKRIGFDPETRVYSWLNKGD